MNKDAVLAVVRHLLTLAGGVLITKGLTDEATATQVVGAICTLIGFGWSITNKVTASK